MYYVVAIIGLAVLMIVHEAGHYFMARRAGMRVTKFSVGFGPTFFKIQPLNGFFWFTTIGDRIRWKLWKHDPEKHGPTIYQVAMIPFLAYVQVAGMNPLEENDPKDKGSYANASLWARVLTIAGGPLSNYLFASVFFFAAIYFNGEVVPGKGTLVDPIPGKPAAVAGFKTNDKILEIDGESTTAWEDIPKHVGPKAGQSVHVLIDRGGEQLELDVVPDDVQGVGKLGLAPVPLTIPVGAGRALLLSLEKPIDVVQQMGEMASQWIHGKQEAKLGGPVAMGEVMSQAAEHGWAEFVALLGALSAYLAVFNLLPLPALDGGRLMFLGFEAVTRKRPDPTMEAQVHAIGLVMFLGLMLYVTFHNDLGIGSK